MFRYILEASVRRSRLVVLLAAGTLVFAGWLLPKAPIDIFPELNAPTVVIMTEAGGLPADEVEQYVTLPIESAVNGLTGVRRVRSSSAISLSIVWVEFGWGFDIFRARQLVSERLSSVEDNLPEGVHSEIAPIVSITGEIMLLSVSSPSGDVGPLELRAYAEYDLRRRLLAVPGVAQVVAIGGELPEYQVNVRSDRMMLYDLTMGEIADAAREAHTTASASYLPNVAGLELPIRQTGRARSVADIERTVVRYVDGAAVTIGQVAEVRLAGAPKRGTAAEGAQPAVVLSVQKAIGTNTLELTRAIDEALDVAEGAAPKGVAINRHVMRQSDFIDVAIANVFSVLRDAAIFVTIVLILFLLNVRTTVITLTAIPLSIVGALLIMRAFGMTMNVMTLGGLAVAIGELVDDAIIYVENIYRRLRQNARRPEGEREDRVAVISRAGEEIRSSVVFATFIICIVFVPLLFLQGLEGRFFRPLGIAYITSILASLIVAITVTPALCRLLLRPKGEEEETDGFLVRWLKARYRPTLERVLGHGRALVVGTGLLTALTLWLASTFGSSFLPAFNEGTMTIFLMAPPGTSLVESDRLAKAVEAQMLTVDGVRSVVRRTGRAEYDEHAEPVSSSEIEVSLKPGYSKREVLPAIDAILAEIPGITTMVDQPIHHRLSHILSGTPADIAINVFGEDLDVLRRVAKEIEAALKTVPGARDVAANREVMVTSVPVIYRPQSLARWGLTPASAAEQLARAYRGETVAVVNQGLRRHKIVVRLHPDERRSVKQLERFILRGKGGAHVRLREVAVIGVDRTSNLIARENTRRKAVVSLSVAEGYNLGHLVDEVRERVTPIVQEHGYSVTFGGQFEAQQSASRTIYWMGFGVVIAILVLLNIALGATRSAVLVMVNLPLALIGGVIAIFLTEAGNPITNFFGLFGLASYRAPVISIASMVGFITLFGIAVHNGILLVNHYHYLMENEKKPLRDAIIQGSMERLVPILMTALTAVLGLVPLAWAAGEPGSELLAPMAIVVLGGLCTSTFLNLIVVPAGYWWLWRDRR